MKFSEAQIRCLGNLDAGRPMHSHCKSQSDWGGLTATTAALHRRGLIDENGITPAGREALKKARAELGALTLG